ncbi:MAG: hypothetical protein Q7S64_01200 [bacterium]|nr:hypothetical protein [bacterium]
MSSSLLKTKTVKRALATIIVSLALWFGLVKPELNRLQAAVVANAEATKAVKVLEDKKKFVVKAEAQFDSIQQDLADLKLAIPDENQTGILVSQVEALAQSKGATINSLSTIIKPKVVPKQKNTTSDSKNSKSTAGADQTAVNDTTAKAAASKSTFADSLLSKYNGLVVSVKLRSNYDGLRQFMSGLTALNRLLVLNNISVSADQTDPNQLESNLTFYAYWQVPPK